MRRYVPDDTGRGRRYCVTKDFPAGVPEDPTLCVMAVIRVSNWAAQQCGSPRGLGPGGEFCRTHAPRSGSKAGRMAEMAAADRAGRGVGAKR